MNTVQKLTVLIPVYNENHHIREVMANVLKGIRKIEPLEVEIIIVDDGSTDGSHPYLKAIHNPPHLNVIIKEFNSGKGSSVKE